MIDKKEAKLAYKLSKKVGAVVAYKNLETNERYIDIAPDLAGVKNRFEFAKKRELAYLMPLKKQRKQLILNWKFLKN